MIKLDKQTLNIGVPLFVTTLSTLLLEIGLTRIFSVVLFYHYAFLVISIALLGLAIGSIAARYIPEDLDAQGRRRLLSIVSLAAGVVIVPVLYYILNTNIWLVNSMAMFLQITKLYMVCLIPFSLAGFVLATVMSLGGDKIPTLYFFDLLGGAAGCMLFIPMIETFGGPSTIIAIALLWALASLSWALSAENKGMQTLSAMVAAVMLVVLCMNVYSPFIDVRYMRGMPVKEESFAKWNSFSRINVFYDKGKNQNWIEIDGGAGTLVAETKLEGDYLTARQSTFGTVGREVAMKLHDKPHTVVIGTGGGPDLQRAVVAGSRKVEAVEINPIIAGDVMRGKYYESSFHIYGCRPDTLKERCLRPEVELHIEDGRTFIHRAKEQFDVIQLSQVDTWASTASGAYGLTENYLYTVDAVRSYVEHLNDNGMVSISRWEFVRPKETLRLVAVGLQALIDMGKTDPENYMVVLMDGKQDNPGARFGTMIIKKTPFTFEEVQKIYELTQQSLGVMSIAYAPFVPGGDKIFRDMILAKDRKAFFDQYEYDVTPVYDSRPFFFFTDRWSNFRKGLYQYSGSGDTVSSSAQHLLTLLLALSVVAVAAFIFLPMMLSPARFPSTKQLRPNLLFCLGVGLGYIIVEISMINKFVVYLGQPVYSLTVVIFSFLISSSLGSHFSQRFAFETLRNRVLVILGIIVALVAVYSQLVPVITNATQGLQTSAKLLVVIGLILPLGYIMGMPFPSVLRITSQTQGQGIEWAWALNSAGTVLGSVLAIFIAVHLGMTWSMLSGLAAYVFALLALTRVSMQEIKS